MRKIFTLLFALFLSNSLFAQLSSGFYRVQNSQSTRYLYVFDNTGYARVIDGKNLDLDLDAIYLRSGLDNTISDPGSIIYFDNVGGSYNFLSQGTSSYSIIQHYLSISERDGKYALSVTDPGTGIRVFIKDASSGTSGYGSVYKSDGGNDPIYWNVLPVSSSSDNYFGVAPKVQVGDKYFTSFYAGFGISPISSNTKAYYVKDFSDCAVLLEELSGSVGAQVPVIIEGVSSSASDNKMDILNSGSSPSDNKLKGNFFDTNNLVGSYNPRKEHVNQTAVQSTHRVISVSSSGKLVFAKPTTSTLPANSAYLEVSSSAKESLAVFFTKAEYDEYNASVLDKVESNSANLEVFNVLGKKVTNNGNLPAGIYIIGGKKTVIR